MPIRNLTDANPDGWNIGQSPTDLIGFYGAPPITQKGSPYQGPIQGQPMGEVVNLFPTLSPSAVAANTTAEQTFTVTGLKTSDFVLSVSKPSAQAGLGIGNARVSAANTLALTFSNNTGSPITPTPSEVYDLFVLRGFPVVSTALTPVAVPANTSMEQQFTIAPVAPVATSVINAAGQVTTVNIASQGSGYVVPPTVVFAGGGPNPTDVQTGTADGLDAPAATAAEPYGSGAAGIAIINSSGNVVAVQIVHRGAGYQVAPAVSFVGGINIARGMALSVCKPTAQAGLGIGGCRVVGANTIAINYFNNTSSAITPNAETYTMVATNEMAARSKIFIANVCGGTISSVGTITSAEATLSLNGLLTTDTVVGVQKPTFQAGLLVGAGRVGGANSARVSFVNPTAAGITPTANEIYSLSVWRQNPGLPIQFVMALLTPASIAANTTAEQTFTLSGVSFINNAPGSVLVNKMSNQPGLGIVNCRVSAANQVALTYQNNSGAAITPPAEWYVFLAGDQVPTGTEAASYTPFTQEAAGFTFQQLVELANATQEVDAMMGLTAGG